MCNCQHRYEVTYPAGHDGPTTQVFRTATAARIAASKVAGATWKQQPKAA